MVPTNPTEEQLAARTGAITPESLQPVQPLQTPTTPYQEPQPDQYAAAIQAMNPADFMAQLDAPSATQTQQDDISNQLLSSIQKLGGQGAFQAQKEKELGLDVSRQQLTDVTSQLMALQNEAKAIPLQVQQDAQGRGVTAGGIQPIQTAALRNNAIKSLGLQSVAATLQGNIALAQQQADKAVELEFAPERTRLEYLSKAYEMNRDRLQREDGRRAQKLEIMLSERSRLLQQAQEDRKIVFGWAAEAAKNGAPSLLIARAQQGSPEEALSMLSEYFVDKDAKAMALLDMEFKREQIKNAAFDRQMQADSAAQGWARIGLEKERIGLDREISTAKLQAEADKAAGSNDASKQTRTNAIELVNNILGSDYNSVVGAPNIFTARTPMNAATRNQINQLRNILALDAREKLKGSGQISDYESRILMNSTTDLGNEGWFSASKLGQKDFEQTLKKTRGVLTVMNGGTINVTIKDPQTGQIQRGPVNREGLNMAAERRMTILYE